MQGPRLPSTSPGVLMTQGCGTTEHSPVHRSHPPTGSVNRACIPVVAGLRPSSAAAVDPKRFTVRPDTDLLSGAATLRRAERRRLTARHAQVGTRKPGLHISLVVNDNL